MGREGVLGSMFWTWSLTKWSEILTGWWFGDGLYAFVMSFSQKSRLIDSLYLRLHFVLLGIRDH